MLKKLPANRDPNLLVGYETSDDAGVYRLTDDMAIITTADFIRSRQPMPSATFMPWADARLPA
jgi:selenophosphate synthase